MPQLIPASLWSEYNYFYSDLFLVDRKFRYQKNSKCFCSKFINKSTYFRIETIVWLVPQETSSTSFPND